MEPESNENSGELWGYETQLGASGRSCVGNMSELISG